MYSSLSKIFIYILIFFSFLSNFNAHSSNQKILYSRKSISNYFSGIISSNNNNNKLALKYFNNLNHLKDNHDQFNRELVFTLVQTQDISELFLYLKKLRKKIGKRTIFNILGPLLSPVECKKQIIGVYNIGLAEEMGRVLERLGTEHAWIVHGDEKYDELTVTGRNLIVENQEGVQRSFYLHPSDVGLKICSSKDLIGGDSKTNAEIIRGILNGKLLGPKKDIVLLNAGSALFINGKVKGIKDGIEMADEIIKSGKALKKLNDLIELSNS